jgi:hypothetical protein
LKAWREAWAAHVNARMIELRIESRIDHRSYEAQGLEFEPQHKIGPMGNGASLRKSDVVAPTIIDGSRGRMARKSSPIRHSRSMASHGSGDLYHPRPRRFYLPAFRRQGAIRSGDSGGACLPDLIALGKDGDDQERFTSREKIATEAWLEKADDELTRRMAHGVSDRHRVGALEEAEGRGLKLSGERVTRSTI